VLVVVEDVVGMLVLVDVAQMLELVVVVHK